MIRDTEGDYKAAIEGGCKFIGVSYGWGFNEKETRFPIANSVEHLEKIICDLLDR